MSGAKEVVVIGGGFAGIAAAVRLHERGVRPLLFSSGAGASRLTSGAFDVHCWTETSASVPVDLAEMSWVEGFLSDAGLLSNRSRGARVATLHGLVRPTVWAGARVLDLTPFSGTRIGVFDVRREEWDARDLCTQWGASEWARNTGTEFVPLSLAGVFSEAELRYPLAAFCRLFDDDERASTLSRALERAPEAAGSPAALICGPWLGKTTLPLEARIPVGEVLSPPEGPFGARVQNALAGLLERFEIPIHPGRAERVSVSLRGVEVEVTPFGASGRVTTEAFGVILATGGLIGGGIGLRAAGGFPPVLSCLLDPRPLPLSGAQAGWDALETGGRWIHPPHVERRLPSSTRVAWAGDVRTEREPQAPAGTVLGTILSGKRAADRVLGSE